MAAGPVPLLTAAKFGDSSFAPGVAQIMIEENPLLGLLPWIPFAGTDLRKKVEGTLPTVGFRQVNADFTESYAEFDEYVFGVAIMGGKYKIDEFEIDVIANNGDLEAYQAEAMAKAASMRFTWEAINGDATTFGFKGLKTLIGEGLGQTTGKTLGALALADIDAAIDLFRNTGGADAILISRANARKLTNLAKNVAGQFPMIDLTTDSFGKRVMHYDGIPLVIIGDALNGSNVVQQPLDYIEASSSSSIYLVKFGRDAFTGLMGKGGSFTVRRFAETFDGPFRGGRLEWYPAVAVMNKWSAVRIPNVTA